MNDKNNDSLEEFFRKGTENHHFEFQEADWAKLEKHLDTSDKAAAYRKPIRKRGFIITAALFVAAAALYFMLDFGNKNKNRADGNVPAIANNEINKEKPSIGLPSGSGMETDAFQHDKKPPLSQNSAGALEDQQDQATGFSESEAVPVPGKNGHLSNAGQGAGLGNTQAPVVTSILGKPKNTIKIQEPSMAPSKTDVDENLVFTRDQIHVLFPVWYVNSMNFSGVNLTATSFPSIPKDPGQADDLIPKEKTNGYRPFLSIGFTAAPDFSSVGIFHYSPPGKRVGASFGYSLSRKFELSAGFILTDNKYSAQGSEYTPPNGYWPNGAVPYKATGKCKILDIPVNIRYNVGTWDKHQVFFSTGISSYLMLEEHYWFKYKTNDPDAIKYWGGKNTSQEILALMNFSVGYEFSPTPRLGLSVEPFIKVPITGIGYGKVDLYTVGGYFTLRYKMFRNSKKPGLWNDKPHLLMTWVAD